MFLTVEETKETIIAFGRLISRSGKVKYPNPINTQMCNSRINI